MSLSSSSSVTPSRRARDEYDESELPHADDEDAASSQARKRRRLSTDNQLVRSEDDESENENESVLPDSYRRSPKGKGRARDGPSSAPNTLQHKPGSIVRIAMKTFVTYTFAEFYPSPGLNMIIGPNGTGKSTVVCGICLGLGWSPAVLGRAKEITEFIKYGSKDATIEIEIKADPDRQTKNPVIKCVISKDGGKTDDKRTVFFLDGKKSTKKAVQELVRSFSIQVDNLCQFLPQDRVVEFSGLSPVALLTQTQKAAAPDYMADWHEELKSMRKEEKQMQEANQSLVEELKKLEDRQKDQAGKVARMRAHTEQQNKVASLEKMKPLGEFVLKRRLHREAKARKKGAQQELRELERRAAPNLEAMNDKGVYLGHMERAVNQKKRLIDSTEKMLAERAAACRKVDEEVQSCVAECQAEKDSGKANKQAMSSHQLEIRKTENSLASPPEPFDATGFNETVEDLNKRINELKREAEGTTEEMRDLVIRGNQRRQLIEREEQQQTHLQSQAGRLASKVGNASKDTGRAWEWVQANLDKFAGPVHGPAMIACHVANPRHVDMVESAIGKDNLLAITVTSRNDFNMLTHQLQTVMGLHDVRVRSCTQSLDTFRAPMSKEELARYGLEGWVIDLVDGPNAVLAALCDNRSLHMIAFSSKDVSGDHLEALKRTQITTVVTPINTSLIVRRRDYGDVAISVKISQVTRASLLTDAPVDTQAEQDAARRIAELNDEIEQIRAEIAGTKARDSKLKGDIRRLEDERDAVKAEKAAKQRQQTAYDGLQTKLDSYRTKLASAQAQHAERYDRLRVIDDKAEDLARKKGQVAIDFGKVNTTLLGVQRDLLDLEIRRIEAQSDYEQLREQNEEETRLLAERKAEHTRLETVVAQLGDEGARLQADCQELANGFNEEEKVLHERICHMEPDALANEIEREKGQLDMLHHDGTARTIVDFEERAITISNKRAQLERVEAGLDTLIDKINEIRSRWEPQLDELVGKISEAFAENLSRIQCAGEVVVHKDEDFDQWAIQIKVKFREEAALNILSKHRQSGGERAVSTAFYLMALQSLARAPFRVVDEINQGMDPRNERLMHSRLVDIACEEHTSQYFLITPKLLNGLKYHPNMKVHCIASGEYVPGEGQLGTFEEMAKKALAIRAAAC